jgi:hypothetical protein
MHTGRFPTAHRRSSRVPTDLPILVTSLSGTRFSQVCKTLVVNAHGCAVLSPVKLDAGVPLRFKSKDGRETTAHVVSCEPVGSDNRIWRLGAKLDQPENFWGLSDCPADWLLPLGPLSAKLQQINSPALALASPRVSGEASLPPEAILDLVARKLEVRLRTMIAESVGPLQAEVAAVKEILARREAHSSRFEVSLSQIPPELEQQLEQRLKKDVGPKILETARNAYAHLLSVAKTTIEQRTIEGYQEFQRRCTAELKIVEKRAAEISEHISASAQQQLRRGLEDFQQKLLDGGNSLKRLSEQLLDFLEQSLKDEYNMRRREFEDLCTSLNAESLRLRQDVEHLDKRIAKLDESARSLESGLDKRLGQMAGSVVKGTRDQLEGMANEALGQFAVHVAKAASDQLGEANEKMTTAREIAVASLTDSVDAKVRNASQAFEHSVGEMARLSVERWRLKLATVLNRLAKNLGEQFEADPGKSSRAE